MESESHVDEYLKRIELKRPTNGPNKDYLNQLHIAHLTRIPFETFDLIDLKYLNISMDYIFNRIVRQQRGGVCHQMNGLFAWILKKLNYHIQLIPCTVYSLLTNRYPDISTHPCICVTLENNEQVLCDVGFSRDFLTPLYFRANCIQYTASGFFRITIIDDGLNYQVEKGFFKKEESLSLPCMSPMQTHIVNIDPDLIKWIISYRFPVDFSKKFIDLDYFQNTHSFILNSPTVILNQCSMCHIHVSQSFIDAYSIMGKEFNEILIQDGVAHRKTSSLSDINDEELKRLLKDKFHIIIERKLELVKPN